MDEYHDRLEDFPEEEEDEDDDSDDDNNCAPSSAKMAASQMKGKAFKMEVMDF